MNATATAGTKILTVRNTRAYVIASLRSIAASGFDYRIVVQDLHRFGVSTLVVEIDVPAGHVLTVTA